MVQDSRWVEVSQSQFAHETEGLNLVRAIMPDEPPFRAWSNFEFRDSRGRWHEVDLLLLGRGQLHLIELKYYSGTLRGDDQRWARDGRRAEDSPLKLARRKAQYFASKLQDELRAWAQETGTRIPPVREVVPFVQESVFLHHPDLRCLLSQASSINLYGLDGHESRSNLPGISDLVLAARRASGDRPQPGADPGQADGTHRPGPAPRTRGRFVGHRGPGDRLRGRVAGLARLPPGAAAGAGPDPVPGAARVVQPAGQGRGAADRRARVPGHVAAAARRAAPPA